MNDTAEKVRFDLASGTVRATGGERLVLMPCSALEELGKSAGVDVACALGHAMGAAFGKAVADRLGSSDAVQASSLETVVTELGSELAVAGWGAVGLERWGRAMVMVVDHSPFTEQRFVAAILQGALGAATGKDVQCWPLGGGASSGSTESVRVLVSGERGIGRAREWLAQGVSWGDVLVRLQANDGGQA